MSKKSNNRKCTRLTAPDGAIYYYSDRKLHREDGPAVVGAGGLVIVYYLNGKKYSKEEFELRASKFLFNI